MTADPKRLAFAVTRDANARAVAIFPDLEAALTYAADQNARLPLALTGTKSADALRRVWKAEPWPAPAALFVKPGANTPAPDASAADGAHPIARIREDAGLWFITLAFGDALYSRHAKSRARAEQIARDLIALALWMAAQKDAHP